MNERSHDVAAIYLTLFGLATLPACRAAADICPNVRLTTTLLWAERSHDQSCSGWYQRTGAVHREQYSNSDLPSVRCPISKGT
jgi:hypothetical protein